jgi:hypothetical protein
MITVTQSPDYEPTIEEVGSKKSIQSEGKAANSMQSLPLASNLNPPTPGRLVTPFLSYLETAPPTKLDEVVRAIDPVNPMDIRNQTGPHVSALYTTQSPGNSGRTEFIWRQERKPSFTSSKLPNA